jgi:cytochrome c-type biogenesis protein CcmH/NrfG
MLKGLALEPEDAETWYYRGNVLLSFRKKPAEAVVAYRKAIALAPDYADAYDGLGQALEQRQDWQQFWADVKSVLSRLDPP